MPEASIEQHKHSRYITERELLMLEAFQKLEPDFQDFFYACMRTREAKGADYSGKTDAIKNFREDAADFGEPFTMRHTWFVLAAKHWKAVKAFVRSGQTESEPIWKRCMDVAVYVSLLVRIAVEGGATPVTKMEDWDNRRDA